MTRIPVGMAVRGHLRQSQANRRLRLSGSQKRESLCYVTLSAPRPGRRQDAVLSDSPCPLTWERCAAREGGFQCLNSLSLALEKKSQLVPAAWAVSVWEGTLLATWDTQVSLTAACPGWEAPGPQTPEARHKW